MFRDPNDNGVNESQPPGSIPDLEDYGEDLPLDDLEPGVAEPNLAILEAPYSSEFSESEVS